MIENYKSYLIQQGYKEYTPSHNASTVIDYTKRIKKICQKENISIEKLANNIGDYVYKYGSLGSETEFGKRSHSSYINALKRFEEFINY